MGSYAGGLAEYTVGRTLDGVRHVFLIYFVQGAGGVWRLDAL